MGSFRYAAASDTWWWSDGVFAVHGFGRGEVVPTTALLLAHAHPADRPRAKQRLRECLSGGKIFSLLYRIVDATGDLRWALLAGEGVFGADGAVTGMRGYLIDLTEPQARARAQEIASATRKAVASRATIEQAKGALMLVYGLDAEAAFALLSWQSQHSNIKLRDLAERLVAAVGGDIYAPSGIRQRLDEIVYSLPDGPAAAIAARGEDSPLAVEQESRDGAVVLRLSGVIDMATGPRLEGSLATALMAAAPPGPLIVDLSGVQHLGSVGIALLTSYHRRCQLSGIGLHVVSGDGPAARVLSIASAGFELSRNVPEALARPRLEVCDDGAASGR